MAAVLSWHSYSSTVVCSHRQQYTSIPPLGISQGIATGSLFRHGKPASLPFRSSFSQTIVNFSSTAAGAVIRIAQRRGGRPLRRLALAGRAAAPAVLTTSVATGPEHGAVPRPGRSRNARAHPAG